MEMSLDFSSGNKPRLGSVCDAERSPIHRVPCAPEDDDSVVLSSPERPRAC